MSLDHYPRGVLVPALTPFHRDLSVDEEQFVIHCLWLLEEGADGLAVFGTTSEANSLSIAERMGLLERLIERGVPPNVLVPGTGCCALPDTVALTRHAVEHGCFGVLMLPPFYYKGVSDNGIFASVAEVIQRIADNRLRIYLYHIPAMAGVGFSPQLIEKLLQAYPGIVAGVKDSSGDWKNMHALLNAFPGFEVFPGTETHLLDALRNGGAGCISATANVNIDAISKLVHGWTTSGADAMQQTVAAVRAVIQEFPLVAANKAILAELHGNASWNVLRPPLMPLETDAKSRLIESLDMLKFSIGHG
jgi:4-hydroxy-tetrahydrodipicolinate synthase